MDPAALVILGLCVIAAAVSAWFARHNNVRQLRADVDDLLDSVERIARDTRSAKMRAVRQVARDESPPPELQQPTAPPETTNQNLKNQLRAKAFARSH